MMETDEPAVDKVGWMEEWIGPGLHKLTVGESSEISGSALGSRVTSGSTGSTFSGDEGSNVLVTCAPLVPPSSSSRGGENSIA